MKIQRYRHDSEYSYALGMTLSIELFKSRPECARHVFISSATEDNDNLRYLRKLCESRGIPVELSDKAFNVLSPKGNCFAITVFEKLTQEPERGNHVVLVNPSDAGNMGTIIRTAVGFGLQNLAVVSPAVDCWDPKTIRASMGSIFHANIKYFQSIEDYISLFPENKLYSHMLRRSVPIQKTVYIEPYSLIFGNEASGLPDDYADFTSAVVIPHSHDIDSLNLPSAAAIAIFTATSSRWGG